MVLVEERETLVEGDLDGKVDRRGGIVKQVGLQREDRALARLGQREGRQRLAPERGRETGLRSDQVRFGSPPDADPRSQTQARHVPPDNIFIGIAAVELLETPLFRVVAHRSPQDGKDLFAVVAVVVGLQLGFETCPVLMHRAQQNIPGIECRAVGAVCQQVFLRRLGTLLREPDIAAVGTLGRGVGEDRDAVDARRTGQVVADAGHLPAVVEVVFVQVDAIAPVIEGECLRYYLIITTLQRIRARGGEFLGKASYFRVHFINAPR